MFRRLLNLLTALSLLLCVAAVALGVRSFFVHDRVQLYGLRHWLILHSTSGVLFVFDNDRIDSQPFRAEWQPDPAAAPSTARPLRDSLVGFDFSAGTPSSPGRVLKFPHWAAAALLALLPSVRLYRRLHHPPDPHRCRTCGYDLRASPDRCPECGTASTSRGAA